MSSPGEYKTVLVLKHNLLLTYIISGSYHLIINDVLLELYRWNGTNP